MAEPVLVGITEDAAASRMRRRLDLSREALLDVTLRINGCEPPTHSDVLFHILSEVNVCRWGSLLILENCILVNHWRKLSTLFKGVFTSLTAMNISVWRGSGKYVKVPLYSLLSQFTPRLRDLKVEADFPVELQTHSLLDNLSKISVPAEHLEMTTKYTKLESIVLTFPRNWIPTGKLPLPAFVMVRCPPTNLFSCFDFQNVKWLRVGIFQSLSVPGENVLLPSLTVLILPGAPRSWQRIKAPALISFQCCVTPRQYHADQVWVNESKWIERFFHRDDSNIFIRPTSFEFTNFLDAQAVSVVLSHWSQLRHLTLGLSQRRECGWCEFFCQEFAREDVICPNLITLKLKTTWGEADSQMWEECVKEMFITRKSGPLEEVSWYHGMNGTLLSVVTRTGSSGYQSLTA